MTKQAKNITENPRIATRVEIRQGYPCLILEVWNDSGRDYLCRHRCYPVDSTRFEQLEALRALVVDTLHIDAKLDDRLNDYFIATLAKLDALLDAEMKASLALEGGAE